MFRGRLENAANGLAGPGEQLIFVAFPEVLNLLFRRRALKPSAIQIEQGAQQHVVFPALGFIVPDQESILFTQSASYIDE
jgi:hypothetical protein